MGRIAAGGAPSAAVENFQFVSVPILQCVLQPMCRCPKPEIRTEALAKSPNLSVIHCRWADGIDKQVSELLAPQFLPVRESNPK
jgi:hypothetical protein